MKDLLSLFLIFFKLGITNFGGGYAMLPLLERDLVQKRGWVTTEEIADYYAIGQVTPGVIAVNVSTFIGMKKKGVLGGIVATLGFIAPAFLIIFVIASLLTSFASNVFVQNALAGIRVCVFVLVFYAIFGLAKKSIADIWTLILTITVAIMAITIDVIPLYVYVIFAAAFGIVVSLIKERYKKKSIKAIEDKTEEVVEESKEDEKEEVIEVVEEKEEKKHKININYKDILFYLGGFLVGATAGIFGLLTFYLVKNRKYKTGVASSLLIWFIVLVSTLVMVFNGNDPILFILYGHFFKIGFLSLGGGLATLPFLKELGSSTGWYTDMDLANMLAVSESTPGGIGVNMSTYVGYTVTFNEFGGNYFLAFLGSIISTLGLVSPSIIIIIIVSLILKKFKDNKYVGYLFYGLRAASLGLIIAALYSIFKISILNVYIDKSSGIEVTINSFKYAIDNAKNYASIHYNGRNGFFECVGAFFNLAFNYRNIALALILGIGLFKFKKHPLIYIAIAAVMGIVFNMYEVTYI